MAVLHTAQVKATNPGGRLFCGIDGVQTRKNGEFGFLGVYADNATHGVVDGQTQIKVFAAPTANQVTGGQFPVVIMQPEMMYDNSRMSLTKFELMSMPAKTPFTCVPLEEGDVIQVSIEAIDNASHNQPTHLAVGQCFALKQNETVLEHKGLVAQVAVGQVYFEIIDVKDAHTRSARMNGGTINDNYKLYSFEAKLKRA